MDPVDDPIPIQPGQHYSMGGIDTDFRGRTRLTNFYAIGECGCVSVHGANRLGGNSLLDCIVLGRSAAEDINARDDHARFRPDEDVVARFVAQERERVKRLVGQNNGVVHCRIRDELRRVMTQNAGIYRTREKLSEAVAAIEELKQQYKSVVCRTPPSTHNYELLAVLELESQLYLGEIVTRGALAREESRGSHFRTDFPKRNDTDWLKHTVARLEHDEIRLTYSDVDVTHYEPAERTF
jgi:succinate dehydrogenase / fumarate reductase flavoprotein subunit